jgi:hypothetical protein
MSLIRVHEGSQARENGEQSKVCVVQARGHRAAEGKASGGQSLIS